MDHYETVDARLPGRVRAVLAAGSGAGKTTFLFNFLKYSPHILMEPFNRVYFFYFNPQPLYNDMKKLLGDRITFIEGAPQKETLEKIFNREAGSPWPCMIILDDFTLFLTKEVVELFTRMSHHNNAHVMLCIHNLFNRSPYTRDITQSANCIVLFKNPRDNTVSSSLGRQLFPGKAAEFTKVFEDATERPYGYLMINFDMEAHKKLRYLSNIFPFEFPVRVFVPPSVPSNNAL